MATKGFDYDVIVIGSASVGVWRRCGRPKRAIGSA